jgi:magnesium transporter
LSTAAAGRVLKNPDEWYFSATNGGRGRTEGLYPDAVNTPEWHDIRDPASKELDELAARYHLHPLHIEDCRNGRQRAKTEDGDGYMFIVLKPMTVDPDSELLDGDLDVFVGHDFVITVSEKCGKAVDQMLDAIHSSKATRPDQIFYKVFDGVVDSYLPLIDGYDDQIDELQDEVLNSPSPAALSRVFDIKHALVDLRRVLVNTRDVAMHMQRIESDLIQRDLWPYFRDIYDHVARNLDLVETQRDLLTGALDVYLSSVANRTNEVMKVLTVLGTATLPAIVITGFYGMNLKGLPYLDNPHGGLIAIAMMFVTTLVLILLLKWQKWF